MKSVSLHGSINYISIDHHGIIVWAGSFFGEGGGACWREGGGGAKYFFFIYFFVVSLVSKSFLGFGFLVLTSLKCCFGGSRFFFDFFFIV